jgi:hypothetical protein
VCQQKQRNVQVHADLRLEEAAGGNVVFQVFYDVHQWFLLVLLLFAAKLPGQDCLMFQEIYTESGV